MLANYVSVEDGTGPGAHGARAWSRRLPDRPSLSTFDLEPVDESGRFTAEAPDWLTGQQVFAANPVIIDRLKRPAICSTSSRSCTATRTAGDARNR